MAPRAPPPPWFIIIIIMKAAKITIGRKLIKKVIQVPLELSCLTVISVPFLSAAEVISFKMESLGRTKDENSVTWADASPPKKERPSQQKLFELSHIFLLLR